jgi:nucleotide-binding universal stress UspA family protein
MNRILAATDGSDGADRAVELEAALAHSLDGSLLILTVTDDLSGSAIDALARSERDLGEAIDLLVNQILNHARACAARAGATRIETLSGWGDPTRSIIDFARQHHADAIVVGRRGRGQLSGLLLGSVSQKLVTLAPCPVIVVP